MAHKKIYALYRGDDFMSVGSLDEIAKEIGCSIKNLRDIHYLTRHRSSQEGSKALGLYEIVYDEGEEEN